MGAWGIRGRQSDYGLDLLGTIVATQLKAVDFTAFHIADALAVIKADIMEEIRKANRGAICRFRRIKRISVSRNLARGQGHSCRST